MKKLIIFLLLAVVGCTTQTTIPKPAPIPCEVKIKGECREQSASERGGAVVRGHSEETKDIKP